MPRDASMRFIDSYSREESNRTGPLRAAIVGRDAGGLLHDGACAGGRQGGAAGIAEGASRIVATADRSG